MSHVLATVSTPVNKQTKYPEGLEQERAAYRHAKYRCTNSSSEHWKDYGGRGIKFLFASFEQFYAHIGPRTENKTLDRINNDGNYEIGNVRWATRKEQRANTRKPAALVQEKKQIMQNKLTLIPIDAGRNKHGQKLVTVQCSCGSAPFSTREDSFKQGRTTSCGFCRKGGRKVITVSVQEKPAVTAPEMTPEVESTFERGTVAYFDDEIKRKTAALISNENHIRFLEIEIAAQDSTNLDTLKKRKAESGSANDLRHEIAALSIEKAQAETAVKKNDKSAAEIMKEKIAALRGKQ